MISKRRHIGELTSARQQLLVVSKQVKKFKNDEWNEAIKLVMDGIKDQIKYTEEDIVDNGAYW